MDYREDFKSNLISQQALPSLNLNELCVVLNELRHIRRWQGRPPTTAQEEEKPREENVEECVYER